MKRLLITLLLGFSTTLFAANGVMYIQSSKAKLQNEPSFGSNTIVELKKGDEVNVVESKGRWVKVKHSSNEGWVSKYLLADIPPIKKKVTILKDDAPDLGDNARRRASAVTTAGAARGLAADERQRNSDSQFTNYKDLEKVEKLGVTEDEVEKFVKEKQK